MTIRKAVSYTVIFLLSLLIIPSAASAQTHVFPATDTNNTFTGANIFTGNVSTKLISYTVATLPSPSLTMTGLIVIVTDAATAGNCTAGSGAYRAICRNTGSVWESLGGGVSNYQTVSENGTPLPVQPTLNLLDGTNTTVVCTDNSGNTSTDCEIDIPSISGSGSPFLGPDPVYDITNSAYGARAVYPPPFTGGVVCAAGSTTIALPGIALVNGDGVTIWGCGPTPSMSTPSAPTVVSGVTNTLTVPDANIIPATESSTYRVRIFNRDRNGGKTAASAVTTITNGIATLGKRTVSITSCAQTAFSLSCTLASAAPLLAQYDLVHITGSTNAELSHLLNIDSVTGGGTVVNFGPAYGGKKLSGYSAEGVVSTGGTLVYYTGNKITWTNSGTGIWDTFICAQRPGDPGYKIIGASYPVNAQGYLSSTSYTDWGTLLSSPPELPTFVTDDDCTAAVATNQKLTTRVVSGAPGTSIVVADAASQNHTDYLIQDNGPNILATFAAAAATGGRVLIPDVSSGYFSVSSFLDLATTLNYYTTPLIQNGPLYFYNTFAPPQTWTGDPGGKVTFLAPGSANPLTICRAALPCIYYGFRESAIFPSNLSIISQGITTNNQAVLMMFDQGDQGSVIKNINFSSTDSTDYTSAAIVVRPGAFETILDNISVSAGPGNGPSYIDATWSPSIYFGQGRDTQPNGQPIVQGWAIRRLQVSARGFYLLGYGGDAGINTISDYYSQGPIMPMAVIQNNFGNIGMPLKVELFRPDTSAQPFLALLGGVTAYLTTDRMVQASVEAGGYAATFTGVAPTSLCAIGYTSIGSGPLVNPYPVTALVNSCSFSQQSYFANDYQDTGTRGNSPRSGTYFSSPVLSQSGHWVNGGIPTLAVPSASAGGTISVGDRIYCAHVMYWNGAMGQDSCRAVTISGGNRTLDFSVGAVIGIRGYQITEDLASCLPSNDCTAVTMAVGTTTYHYTGGSASGDTIPVFTASGAGPVGFDAAGFFGPKYFGYKTSAPTCVAGGGYYWFDTTDSRWEFCNGSGSAVKLFTPAVPDIIGGTTPAAGSFTTLKGTTLNTTTNCADSAGAAACGSAATGAFVVDVGATTTTVSETGVTAASRIFVKYDASRGSELSVTCNTSPTDAYVTTVTASTSFVVTIPSAPVTNPACLVYEVFN